MDGCLIRGWCAILPGCGGTGEGFPRGSAFTARASPRDWPRAGGGERLGQWDWAPENAGMKVICLLYCVGVGVGWQRRCKTWESLS